MEIYVDVLIIENCIVNFFLLTLTMKCIKHKCKTITLISSSFIGGIYTIVVLIPKLNILACLRPTLKSSKCSITASLTSCTVLGS